MTKTQRVVLEQAYINYLVCPIQQGDSWGQVDEKDSQKLFDDLGNAIRSLQTMGDELLLSTVEACHVDEYWGGQEEYQVGLLSIPKFDTFNELMAHVLENVDGGDLNSIAVLAIAYLQAKQ